MYIGFGFGLCTSSPDSKKPCFYKALYVNFIAFTSVFECIWMQDFRVELIL